MTPSLLIFSLFVPAAELPLAPPPRPAGLGLLPGADPSLADWTPRPALGHHEPWERMTDKDWTDARFGQINTPTPKGDLVFAVPTGPGWADANGKWEAKEKRFTAPLQGEWAKYRG